MGHEFILLKTGAGPKEEPSAGDNLLDHYQVSKRLFDAAVSFPPGNYLKSLPGSTQWYRGDRCDLEPLGRLPPAQSSTIDWKPTNLEMRAFRLDSGEYELDKELLGPAVDTALAPVDAPDMAAIGAASQGSGSELKPRKEKKHKKEKKEKKDKREGKRQRTE